MCISSFFLFDLFSYPYKIFSKFKELDLNMQSRKMLTFECYRNRQECVEFDIVGKMEFGIYSPYFSTNIRFSREILNSFSQYN